MYPQKSAQKNRFAFGNQELWRYQGLIYIVVCWALEPAILALSYRLWMGVGGDFCLLFLLLANLGTALLASFDSAREYWRGKHPRSPGNTWNYFVGVILNRIYAFFAFFFVLLPGLDIRH